MLRLLVGVWFIINFNTRVRFYSLCAVLVGKGEVKVRP